MSTKEKVNKFHRDYKRFEALKYDIENGTKLPLHKLEEFERLKKIFNK